MSAQGSTVVFLHGFAGAAASWARVRAALPGPSMAIDLPGHAGRPMVPSWSDAIGAIGAEIPAGAWLVGYSLGGRLALGLAEASPDRWAGLVLIGAHPGLETEHDRGSRRISDDHWADRLSLEGPEKFFEAWDRQPVFGGRTFSPEILEEERAWRAKHDPEALAAALKAFSLGRMPSYWSLLSKWKKPLVYVAGERDAKFVELAERVRATAKHATISVIPGAKHVVPLEAPEALAALLG